MLLFQRQMVSSSSLFYLNFQKKQEKKAALDTKKLTLKKMRVEIEGVCQVL